MPDPPTQFVDSVRLISARVLALFKIVVTSAHSSVASYSLSSSTIYLQLLWETLVIRLLLTHPTLILIT